MDEAHHNALLKARKVFLEYDGVIGVGIGPKLKGNKIVAPKAIIVLVEKSCH